jgi:uncharacterized membrane protein YdjX (TVP38/TMEM64 family)
MSTLFANIAKHQIRRNAAARDSDDEQQESDQDDYSNFSDKAYEDFDSTDELPDFLPLEEHNHAEPLVVSQPTQSSSGIPSSRHAERTASASSSTTNSLLSRIQSALQKHTNTLLNRKLHGKKVMATIFLLLVLKVVVAAMVLKRLTSVESSPVATTTTSWFHAPFTISGLLQWTQKHPLQGMLCLVLVIAGAVVIMVPVGTPLTLGCGYIYKGAYGWKVGLGIATFVAIGGSALGAITCFLLGRYLMREQVRSWTKKYPLFGAIDIATKENGLKIMAMLYLTPILPLGPVSYMCGTTSMKLSHFAIAKIASLPLMFLYTFIGASMSALIGTGTKGMEDELKEIEQNQTLIISGICLSFVMIAGITHYIKKELNRVSIVIECV